MRPNYVTDEAADRCKPHFITNVRPHYITDDEIVVNPTLSLTRPNYVTMRLQIIVKSHIVTCETQLRHYEAADRCTPYIVTCETQPRHYETADRCETDNVTEHYRYALKHLTTRTNRYCFITTHKHEYTVVRCLSVRLSVLLSVTFSCQNE